jgi:hypothetical protein
MQANLNKLNQMNLNISSNTYETNVKFNHHEQTKILLVSHLPGYEIILSKKNSIPFLGLDEHVINDYSHIRCFPLAGNIPGIDQFQYIKINLYDIV